MNVLAKLNQKLKIKPAVAEEEEVAIVIQEPTVAVIEEKEKEAPVKTKIIEENDDGAAALNLLKRLERQNMTRVGKKPDDEKVSKAPVIEEEAKKAKPKKQKIKGLLAEDIEKVENIVEGGPQMKEAVNAQAEVVEAEEKEMVEGPAKPTKRYSKKVITNVVNLGPAALIKIGDTPIGKRLPPPPVFDIKASSYYMNNREIFVNFINNLFEPYKEDLMDETQNISCDNIGKDTGKVGLLTHQKIVRDYINLYSPYRGLLLFHGLGSGKTCSSIAIAEGLKSYRQIIVMTPASLRRNYMEEIKKCGDLLFRKNQFWEWVSVEGQQELIEPLAEVLGGIKINYANELHSNWINYIRRRKGAWFVNVTKPSNYEELSTSDKKSLNDQIDEMIQLKYTFINYNGLRRSKFKEMTADFTKNVFDNAVVIIDEAHNFISRIVNKIGRFHNFSERKRGPGTVMPPPLALQMYEFLLQAENCRVVMLTGTPIINYPNEIAVLYNILRGYIKTWNFSLNADQLKGKKLDIESIRKAFAAEKILDYMDFNASKELSITRNPFGFENKIKENEGYKGVYNRNESIDKEGKLVLDERGVMSDEAFVSRVIKILKKELGIEVNPRSVHFTVNTALPDTMETFVNTFINRDTGKLINEVKFKRRIIGLTSYFKSAQEELLPAYNRDINRHIVRIPMSDYQFQIYEMARHEERKNEKGKAGEKAKLDVDGQFILPKATYKIFSRLFCNFVMPEPPGRPTPGSIKDVKSNNMLEEYQKNSRDEKKAAVEANIKKYLDSFPAEYKENPENNQLIKSNIEKYMYYIVKKEYDVVDFDKFLSEEYQADIKRIDEKKKTAVVVAPNKALAKEEKARLKEEEARLKALEKEKLRANKEEELRLKALEKEEKEKLKALEKEEKEKLKALEKEKLKADKEEEARLKALEKEKLKADKEEEARLKAEEKARLKEEKEKLKADKKKGKGQDASDTESSSDSESSDSDSDISDSDSDASDSDSESSEKPDSYLINGGAGSAEKEEEGKDVIEDFYNIDEDEDDIEDETKKPGYIEGYKDVDTINRTRDELEGDEVLMQLPGKIIYKRLIAEALDFLNTYKHKYLSLEALKKYSPKFMTMIENIEDHDHAGLHLVYSQFRSMEGIGIFALALEANGYAQFKIVRTSVGWDLVTSDEDMGKPHYALYTGTEDAEEREIIRNIYNGDWNYIPNNIAAKIRKISSNNNMGEIIKVFMITSAGSEGINLRNTRYVHIMEPYWHPVRLEQVIGRARRICSHQSLPLELRTVDVFIYLMTLTPGQIDGEFGIELKLKDRSNLPPFLPQTSDEKLFEISTIKENLTDQILKSIKSSSVDCITHTKSNMKEGIVCLSFGDPPNTKFSYNPNLEQDQNDTIAEINVEVLNLNVKEVFIESIGKKYMLDPITKNVYDHESIILAKQYPGIRPILLGKLILNEDGEYEIIKKRI